VLRLVESTFLFRYLSSVLARPTGKRKQKRNPRNFDEIGQHEERVALPLEKVSDGS